METSPLTNHFKCDFSVIPTRSYDVNVNGNTLLSPNATDGSFTAMQKPTFYRERARVAENLAKLCRDETAKQMLRRVAERWRELARLARPRKPSDAQEQKMVRRRRARRRISKRSG